VEDPASFLVTFGETASSAPRDTTAVLLAGPADRGPFVPTTAVVVDSEDHETLTARLQPFVELAPLMQHQVVVTPYAGVMNLHAADEQHGQGEPVGRSGLLNAITPAFAAEIAALLRSGSVQLFQLRSLGGATADVPAEQPPSPTGTRGSRSSAASRGEVTATGRLPAPRRHLPPWSTSTPRVSAGLPACETLGP
jgi:hypothetical protein